MTHSDKNNSVSSVDNNEGTALCLSRDKYKMKTEQFNKTLMAGPISKLKLIVSSIG